MTIEQFIGKAIEGGYCLDGKSVLPLKQSELLQEEIVYTLSRGGNLYRLMLDPLAWQAVAKIEGYGRCAWCKTRGECRMCGAGINVSNVAEDQAKKYMHRMIDALAEGKTLEQFISTL